GALPALAQDAAGQALLDLLAQRRMELGASTLKLRFSEWREWLNGELESALFRDSSIASPVVMTHLAATRLRNFDAAILIGADRRHLAVAPSTGLLGHRALRAEFGLSTPEEEDQMLRDDLAALIACSDEVLATWQHMLGSE